MTISSRETGSSGRARSALVVIGVVALTALAGCSSSGKGGSSSSSSTPVSTPAASASAASTSAATSGAGTPADAVTTKAVTTAYETFFDIKATTAQTVTVLQHGSAFSPTLAGQAKAAAAQKLAATVSKVNLASPNVADVTFTLTSNGSPLLPNTHGKAVREGGTWKVAAETFCALLGLQGTPPAVCKDPKMTALPN
ncbi:MAG: hypothetical protein QOJ78_3 [Pseudonocardiales bacterium]|jgi:hypothetical protein|nr:hypothetical protein [Pseudonocardiales bacterium]